MSMWRNKQDCLWILNEPEVLVSFLAGAAAVPLVTSSVYDLTFNSGLRMLHYSHFHIPLHLWGLNSPRMVSIPKGITLPTVGCPHAYFISGKSISAVEEVCLSASVWATPRDGDWTGIPGIFCPFCPWVSACIRWYLLNFTQTHCI